MMEYPRNLFRMAAVVSVTALPLAAVGPGQLTLKVDPQQVDFLAGTELVTRYHRGPDAAKPFFWPVIGPRGVPLTRAWPMEKAASGGSTDHVHQKSVWFTHGDVILEGLKISKKTKGVAGVDFWSEGPSRGVIVCTAVDQPELGTDRARLLTHNEWRTGDGQKVLDEARTIDFHDYGDARLIVVEVDLHASVGAVTFGDTKEGSFGVRVNDQIRASRGAGKIENADGKVGEKACWGRLSGWCDYSGTIDGKAAGIAVLDDPKNPHPACWHVRGYGLMAANPFGRGKSGFPAMKGRSDLVKLAKGEHLKLRYGVLLHAGDAHVDKVAEYFERFVNLRK
jgi:hypothetical protein